MQKEIYLISKNTYSDNLKEMYGHLFENLNKQNVLVLNLTSNDNQKLVTIEKILNQQLSDLGFSEVDFINQKTDDRKAVSLFKNAEFLYLPGGNTEILIKNIKQKKLNSLIKSFQGVITANSAGAYVISPEYLKIRDDKVEIIPTMGLIDFSITPHYNPKVDTILKEFSKNRLIYAYQDGSAIAYEKEIKFFGDVWKFYKGNKEKVN